MKIKVLMVILLLFSFSILSGCIKEKASQPNNKPPHATIWNNQKQNYSNSK